MKLLNFSNIFPKPFITRPTLWIAFLLLSVAAPVSESFAQTNNAPVASNVSFSFDKAWGAWQVISPLVGTDAEGEALKYRIVSLPSSGALSTSSGGNAIELRAGQEVTTPQLYFKDTKYTNAVITFTYTVIDASGKESSSPAVYSIYVGATPVPSAMSKITKPISNIGEQAEITLEAKGGQVIGYRITSLPASTQGKLSLKVLGNLVNLPITAAGFYDLSLEQASQLVFTPNPSFSGIATFTYVAADAVIATNARKATTSGKNARYSAPATLYIPVTNPTVLPVELTSFSAKVLGGQVALSWETASEKENDYFQVERSADGKGFQAIGKVKGNGTSNVALSYSFEDRSPLAATAYYRLKQVDFDGKSEYSKVVAVKKAIAPSLSLKAYPNPTQGKTFLNLEGLPSGNVTVNLTHSSGRVVSRKLVQEGQELAVDLSNEAAGIYFAQVETATWKSTVRVIKQ